MKATTATDLVPANAAAEINAELQAMQAAGQKAIDHALTVGQMLLQAKAKLPHGRFKAWIEVNVDCSIRHAQRFMALAKNDTRVAFDPDASIRGALQKIVSPKPSTEAATGEAPPGGERADVMHAAASDAEPRSRPDDDVHRPVDAGDGDDVTEPGTAETDHDHAHEAIAETFRAETERTRPAVHQQRDAAPPADASPTADELRGELMVLLFRFCEIASDDDLLIFQVHVRSTVNGCIGTRRREREDAAAELGAPAGPGHAAEDNVEHGAQEDGADQKNADTVEREDRDFAEPPADQPEATAGANTDEITVTGLLTVFAGPNRDRIQVYSKATISGTVVQQHGAHAHGGVEGTVVELAGGRYAWVEPTIDQASAAAA